MIKSLDQPGSLHHVEIYVSNLQKSIEFWSWLLCDKLGYSSFQKWDQGQSFILGQTYLVFVQAEERFLDVAYHRCRTGLNHLAFKASSPEKIDELNRELMQRGCKMLYPDRYPHAGGNYHAVFFEDPDRIKVEVAC
ncbi:MAG: VOC family protein [Candidatus Rifleibacteriota bacterium]